MSWVESEDYLEPKEEPHPMHKQWDIQNIAMFGAMHKGDCSKMGTIKLAKMQLEISTLPGLRST